MISAIAMAAVKFFTRPDFASAARISGIMVPVIETARLVLREPRHSDFDAVSAMWGDPNVTRYITAEPMARRQSWTFFTHLCGQWLLCGYGGWTVEQKHSGAFVGQVLFQQFLRDIDATREHLPEAGWALASAMHGRGYASEAVAAALAWADANIDVSHSVAIINPENAASLRVAERAGYRELRRTDLGGRPIILLERARFG
jgi:RimJ/RimL family protein N-acetyltransferase